jgi:hypothetical protein
MIKVNMMCSSKGQSMSNPILDRLSTAEGLYDAFKFGDIASSWFLRDASSQSKLLKLQKTFNRASTLISSINTAKQLGDTVGSLCALRTELCSTGANGSKQQNIAKATACFARNCLDTTIALSDTAVSFHDAKWIDLGQNVKGVNAIFYGADIVGNALDIKADLSKIEKRVAKINNNAHSPEKKKSFFHKNVISHINIIKNCCCLIGSIMGLASLLLGGPVALPIIGLILSSTWIVSKISIYFYGFFTSGAK